MPTYVYACDTCGKQFEQFQSFKESPLQACPCEQHSSAIRRVFQPVGIVFKGSGWYITDSRNTNNMSDTTRNKGDKSDTTTKTEAPSSNATAD